MNCRLLKEHIYQVNIYNNIQVSHAFAKPRWTFKQVHTRPSHFPSTFFLHCEKQKKKSAPLLWDQVSHVGRKNSRSQEGETLKEQIKEHKNPKFVQILNPFKAIFTYIFPISNYIPKHKLCLFLFSNSQFHFSKSNLKKISRHDLAAICSVFPLQ